MKLLHQNFEQELTRLAASAVEVKVLIAFLTEGGLTWLTDDIVGRSEFIVGTDLNITSPGALKSLQDRGAGVWVFREPGKMFHPKAIYLRCENDEYLIVGSNNLTSSGISSNHEISVLFSRNETSEDAFANCLAHFESLKDRHEFCEVPGEEFYRVYQQAKLQQQLQSQLELQAPLPAGGDRGAPLEHNNGTGSENCPSEISSIGEFLRAVATQFPNIRINKPAVKQHPLKRLNDEQFVPRFEQIVTAASSGRLTAYSWLNQGGNWRRIPNIFATDELHEPYEKVGTEGRIILQIHFSADYSEVSVSVILQYNIPGSVKEGEMPDRVSERCRRLLDYLDGYSSSVTVNGEPFRHWVYNKDNHLWSKPLISKRYGVENLPADTVLRQNIELFARALNSALGIH